MPYFINTYRVPKPGQFTAVTNDVAESVKAIGRAGYVNIPVSPPNPFASSMGVISTLAGFETLDDVDALIDRLTGDDSAGTAARDRIGAKCDLVNVSVSRILSPVGTPPEGFVAKYISRTWVVAKPGQGPALVEHLLEWREELDLRWKPVVSVPLGGAGGSVRVSTFFEGLQGYEDFGEQVAASPRLQKFTELVSGPPVRGVGRITYWNQP